MASRAEERAESRSLEASLLSRLDSEEASKLSRVLMLPPLPLFLSLLLSELREEELELELSRLKELSDDDELSRLLEEEPLSEELEPDELLLRLLLEEDELELEEELLRLLLLDELLLEELLLELVLDTDIGLSLRV